MTVSEIPKRLVTILTLQVGTCIYCIFIVGAMLKSRRLADMDTYLPPVGWFAVAIKDWGWLLFLLPCLWFFVHVRAWLQTGADFALLGKVVISGLAVLALLVWLAMMGSMQALGPGTLLQSTK